MERIGDIIALLLYIYTMNPGMYPPALPHSGLTLSSFPVEIQEQFVSRAMGEARGDGHEAVKKVVGTMICRFEDGYGEPHELLGAYYAPDFPVTPELVEGFGDAQCEGFKYALSSNDIAYLQIPTDEPRECVGDTCFFRRWVSNK